MARQAAVRTVYPPRYFTGFIVVQERDGALVRVRFPNAPWFPLGPEAAMIVPGMRGSPYYGADRYHGAFPAGLLHEIQYAISIFDERTGRHRIEKFNHAFQAPARVRVRRLGEVIELFCPSGPLFRVYRADEVMSRFPASAVPVVQFIA